MEKRPRGRPRTTTPDQKREAARERQQERRRRLAENGGRSITLAVPGDLLAALDAEAKQRGISKSEVLLETVRVQIHGSETAAAGDGADPGPRILGSRTESAVSLPQIHGSGTPSAGSEPVPDSETTEIRGSQPRPPRYRGRALLLAAAVGAILGSWATLLLS